MSSPNSQRADKLSIFISASFADRDLEEALQRLLVDLIPGVEIRSSGETPIGAGSEPDWQKWVLNSAQNSSFAMVLLTPRSISRPWLAWEAGAISAIVGSRKYQPIAFDLDIAEIPMPWTEFQIVRGDRRDDVTAMLERLLRDIDAGSTLEVARRLDSVVQRYIERIQQIFAERAIADDVPHQPARRAEPVPVLDDKDLRMLCELLFRLVVKGRLRPEMLQSVEATAFWAAVREDRASASTLDDLRSVNADLVSLGAPGALWASWMRNVRAMELALLLRHGDMTIQSS